MKNGLCLSQLQTNLKIDGIKARQNSPLTIPHEPDFYRVDFRCSTCIQLLNRSTIVEHIAEISSKIFTRVCVYTENGGTIFWSYEVRL